MNFTIKLRHYLLMLTIFILLVIELPIITAGFLVKPEPGDTIIVLGAKLIGGEPSTMLRLRLDEAVKLYNEGYASTVIVSGAQGADEESSEALAMQSYLIFHGIPMKDILLEDQSFNTYQNLTNSQAIMREHGLKQAIIVSNASHIHRALVLAHHLGITATGAPAPMAHNTYLTAKQYAREGAAMVALLVFNK
ncbi:MAG: YdcF family protein [Veillonellales bacterium]